MRASIALCGVFLAGLAPAAEPSPAAAKEIQHLLSRLEKSGCQFFRNGTWHSSKEARSHLQQKHDYLLRKGLLSTAESFIELGGTRSSSSSKPYQVRCAGDAEPRPSAAWLKAELDSYRRSQR